jgi:hypothetical protein
LREERERELEFNPDPATGSGVNSAPSPGADLELIDDGLRNLLHSLVVTGTALDPDPPHPSPPRSQSPAPTGTSMLDWNLFAATEDTNLSAPSMDQQGVALISQELMARLNEHEDEVDSQDEDEERSGDEDEQEALDEPTVIGN